MTGPSLAEVLDAHYAEPSELDCVGGKWIYAKHCDCGWIGPSGDHTAHQADAVTAHLAAILTDVETVEAVAKVFSGSVWPHNWEQWADEARAAIAVIAARIGCEVRA